MLQVQPDVLRQVEQALQRYISEVQSTNLTDSTQKTYILHAEHFVSWLKGEFDPGSRKK